MGRVARVLETPALRPPRALQLATLVDAPPEGPEWLHEQKFDGYRILAVIERGEVKLMSRRFKDWTAEFPTITRALAELPVERAILDGEVCVLLPDGRTTFQGLQNSFGGDGVGVVYFGWVDTDLVRQDAHPDLKAVRGLPGPLGRAIPVGQAAAAVLRAVEGRRRTVVEPRWLAPTLPLRGLVRPLLDVPGRRSALALERRWERAAAARGVRDASRPRGPSRTGT